MYKKNTSAFNYEPVRFSKPSKKDNKQLSKDEVKNILKQKIEKRVNDYETNYFNSPSLLKKRIEKIKGNLLRVNTKINFILNSKNPNDYFVDSTARIRKTMLEVELFRLESRLNFLNDNPDIVQLYNGGIISNG